MNIIRRKFWDYISNRAEKLGVVPAEKPENEKARLQDLSNLNLVERKLDIDQRFSSLPRLAAYLTICPQASINIIDENIQHCKVDFGKNHL